MIKPQLTLKSFIVLGFVLRLLFVFTSNHVYHPDEIFQSLELSHRLVYGFGIIPWDYLYGLRSFVIPLVLSLPLFILKFIGVTQPVYYTTLIKIILVVYSLVLIPAAYEISYTLTKNNKTALFAAFLAAIWYELIYMSPRALTEVLATHTLAAVILLMSRHRPKYVLSGLLLGTAVLLRPQYIPALFLAFWCTRQYLKSHLSPILAGIFLAILVFGLVDVHFYGTFLIHPINNLRLSLLSGISREFGTQPWWYYAQAIIITSSGLVLLLLHRHRHHLALKAVVIVAIILATHSLIPHKEYRFIFLAIPLYLILIAPTLINLFKKKAYVVALSASLLGCAGILPGAKHYYLQPFFFNDPVLAQTNDQVYSSPNCSLFLPQRDWTYTGGSYYHHLSQIYSVDYLPKDISPHFILQPSSLSSPEGYEGTLQTNGYTLYQSDQVCHPSEDYTSIRSFKYLEPYLENIPLALK